MFDKQRTENLENSRYLLGNILLMCCLIFSIPANAQYESKEPHVQHKNVAFIGGGMTFLTGDHSQIVPALEVGYERNFKNKWGLIGILETEFEKSHLVYVLGLGPSFDLGSKSYLYLGPAIEFGDHSTKLTFNAMFKCKVIEFEKSYIKLGTYVSWRRQLSVASIGLVTNWAFPF